MREVFISHASADEVFVAELRRRLEAQGVVVWVDSRSLRGGDGPVTATAANRSTTGPNPTWSP